MQQDGDSCDPNFAATPMSPHSRQSVHYCHKCGIFRNLAKRLVKRTVCSLAVCMTRRLPTVGDDLLQISDIRVTRASRSLGPDRRLQHQAGAQQFLGTDIAAHDRPSRKVSRPLPDECALAHMPPDQPVALQHVKSRAHCLPAALQSVSKITLGWQAITG